MLDNLEKTARLIAALKSAVPFQVAVMPNLIDHLAGQQKPVVLKPLETVSDVSYLGDEGGIVCHIQPEEDADNVIIVSLTHVRVPRTFLLATAVLDYQKHRVKKLKKQRHAA
jgi:hypothetical protein